MRIVYFQIPSSVSKAFSEACLGFTPKVYCPSPNEVFLDIGVTEKFFGGEECILALVEKLLASFDLSGITQVLTDRPEWATALAMSSKNYYLPGESQSALLELPIERLIYCGDPKKIAEERKDREQLVAFMKRVGMITIADFCKLPTTAVERRFGKLGILLQQYCRGERKVVLPLVVPTDVIREFVDTEEIGSMTTLLNHLEKVFFQIEARLFGRMLQARAIKFIFNLESRKSLSKYLKLSEPTYEAAALLKLLQEFFRDLTWDSPLHSLEIEVVDTEPLVVGQLSLFDQTENRMGDLSKYVNRLRTRYGEQAVGFAEPYESYVPERSWRLSAVTKPARAPARPEPACRPPFLYSPPRPQNLSANWRLRPSENLACEWWENGGQRCYFVADTGREKLWIFWDCQRREWYLHGTFD